MTARTGPDGTTTSAAVGHRILSAIAVVAVSA